MVSEIFLYKWQSINISPEVLTHVFSHLPPHSLTSIALVSRRFHSLITTPHAWRIAFARYFPGSARIIKTISDVDKDETITDKRYFSRLSTLASWRSEYILRTRLLRALSRGRPGEAISSKPRSTNLTVSQVNYFSSINLSITHIDAVLINNPNKPPPKFIHGANQNGLATASEPSLGKADGWGFRDPFSLNEFVDMYPREAQYGLGRGQMVGLPNALSVSRRHGMICGEGIPGGRIYFRSIEEQRGHLLMTTRELSVPEFGVPFLDSALESTCSVWISKSCNIPDMTNGLIGMISGSSLGVVTAYSLGSHSLKGRRLDRGEMTARWVLSPGIPIIALSIDEQYSTNRFRDGRIWIVALNALGEVFYASDLPKRAVINNNIALTEDATYQLSWETGRNMSWSLVEPTRRSARIDPYENSSFDGSYSPRGSSESMGLSKEQIFAETKEIEQYVQKKPSHFQSVCEGWDMRRRLEVDFAGCNENQAGESVVIFECALEDEQRSRIRRFTRLKQTESVTPQAPGSQCPVFEQLDSAPESRFPFQESSWSFESTLSRRTSNASFISSTAGTFETWRVSALSLGNIKAAQITTTAIDSSRYALMTVSEDPLLNLSASGETSPMALPLDKIPRLYQASQIPGQRARFLAVGTNTGTINVWNLRARISASSEIVNVVEPLRIIHTDSPQISCLALTSLYLVHGGNDGLVQAWDPLASNIQPLRTINSRFSSRARRRIAQAEASPWGVGVNLFAAGTLWLDPEPTFLRGMVSLGGHLRYWSYSSQSADQYKSSKRRLRKSERGSNHGGERITHTGRGAIHDYIANEKLELEKEKKDRCKEEARLAGRFGIDLLGPEATEDEVMAYATMLSEESAKKTEVGRGKSPEISEVMTPIGGSSAIGSEVSTIHDDANLAAAIQASIDQDNHVPALSSTGSSQVYSVRYGKGRSAQAEVISGASKQPELDDLDFALQMSIAEEQSRLEFESADFPALVPSISSSDGKNKGKSRS